MHGPTSLSQHTCFWRKKNTESYNIPSGDPEVKAIDSMSCVTIVSVVTDSWIQRICDYYNSFTKIIRSIAWLRRFAHFKSQCDLEHGPLTVPNYSQAHNILIRHVQSQSFEREIRDLKTGRPLLKSSLVLHLNPFLDHEGILRVGGRTDHHPILISHTHHVASSIVMYYYSQAHTGCEWVLSLIR